MRNIRSDFCLGFFLFVLSIALLAGGAGALDLKPMNITLVGQDPSPVNPGATTELFFKVGKGAYEGGLRVVPEYPFTAVGNDIYTSKNFGGDEFPVRFRVKVDESAPSGNNILKIRHVAGASDAQSLVFESQFNVSVANTRTDFDFVVQEVTRSSISLALTNAGKNVAAGVVLRVTKIEGAEIVGTSSNTIGSLNPGDFTIVTFSITPKANDTSLSVNISYTDTLGNRYDVQKSASVRIPSPTQAERPTIQRGILTVPVFVFAAAAVVAAIAVAFFVLRRKRRR